MHGLTAAALVERLLAWTRGAEHDDTFEALILAVFAYQYERNAVYRRWCDSRGRAPATMTDWREIPAMPQAAFKEWTLATFDTANAVARFDSSGTTQGTPSRHFLETLALYDAAVVPPFRSYVLPDGIAPCALALVSSPAEAPHSSLSHMVDIVGRHCCAGRVRYFVVGPDVDVAGFLAACETAAEPVCILTTAFALVHVLDAMEAAQRTLRLPPGSRIMETGGYKGRTRALSKAELYAWVAERFGVPESHIVNEYGMAELSSQWYDTTLYDAQAGGAGGPRHKTGPPWVRARILDPRTGLDAVPGDVGLIRLYDPMNLGSVCCVQTEDLGRRLQDGFEVLGRATDADLRGCSLELDTF